MNGPRVPHAAVGGDLVRPVVAVDVLNPDDPAGAAELGYQPHRYTGPDHGRWLRELAGHGAELVWCTS